MNTNFKLKDKSERLVMVQFMQNNGRNGRLEYKVESRPYAVEALPGEELPRLFETIVVMCSTGPQVAVVVDNCKSIAELEVKEYAYVVGRVDVDAYMRFKEKQELRVVMEQEISKKAAELEKVALWEIYADKFPEFKTLLDEYKSL